MAEHDRDLVATIADAVSAYLGVGSPKEAAHEVLTDLEAQGWTISHPNDTEPPEAGRGQPLVTVRHRWRMGKTNSDAWEYMTYGIPAADAATTREIWEKGLNDLGRQGWEAVGTVTFPVTANHGLSPQVERTDALLLKRSTAPG
jgi:hypothetical protein